MERVLACRAWAMANWFLLFVPMIWLFELFFARGNNWSEPGFAEAAMLFDLCAFVPALYVLCHGRQLTAKALALRVTGLFCLGIFIASQLIPAEGQKLLTHLSWGRPFGIAFIILLEVKVLIELVKIGFSGRKSAEEVAAEHGVPTLLAKLLLLEARFWKAVWRIVRGGGRP